MINITLEKWADEYTLFSFKLTIRPISYKEDVSRALSHSGEASFDFIFQAPTDKYLKVIVMYQMGEIIKINKFNRLLVS